MHKTHQKSQYLVPKAQQEPERARTEKAAPEPDKAEPVLKSDKARPENQSQLRPETQPRQRFGRDISSGAGIRAELIRDPASATLW